ncbi:unnamed protein product, partial [Durusdinium trenchii]
MGTASSWVTRTCEDSCWSGLVHWFQVPLTKGDLVVSGFPRRSNGSANGVYAIRGEHHGRPVFERLGGAGPFIYFWDDRDGATWCGWWLGPIVGGAEVWGYNAENAHLPPSQGWRSPWHGLENPQIRMSVPARTALQLEVHPKKQEVVPSWLQEPGDCEALTEDPQLLQCCCICLEPLWDAEPSVFLMNLERLCPHYFCSQCAKRIVVEQTSLGLQNFKEDMRIASVDGLSSVLDSQGTRLGDLVWCENGARLTDGELYLVLSQLERLVELEVGMEFRRTEEQALVLQEGVLFGCLLQHGRSLRRITAEELSIEGLDRAVVEPGTVEPLRRRFVVLRGGEVSCWSCGTCSLENTSSDFRCKLCGSPPTCPQEMPKERALGPHGVAALRTRFALRPQLHWAVKLQCPLWVMSCPILLVKFTFHNIPQPYSKFICAMACSQMWPALISSGEAHVCP